MFLVVEADFVEDHRYRKSVMSVVLLAPRCSESGLQASRLYTVSCPAYLKA